MPHIRVTQQKHIFFLLFPALIVSALASACTRNPYDANVTESRNDDFFTHNSVLEGETIWQLAVASAPDGKIAAVIATDYREMKILESSAGAWSIISTISGGGLHPSYLSIAPGPAGSWWVLASDSNTGMKLYRIGGSGDSTLVIPTYNTVAWDSTSQSAVVSDSQGRPITVMHSGGQGLIRAALTDTGWTHTRIAGTGLYTTLDDFAIDPLGSEHILYHRDETDSGQYGQSDIDSTITLEIPNSGSNLSLTVSAVGSPFVTGSVGYQNNLMIWQLLDSDEQGAFWVSETLSLLEYELYIGNFDICVDSDDQPYVAFAVWESSSSFSVFMTKRDPAATYGWSVIPVVEGLSRIGATNRMKIFRMVIDSMDDIHLFYVNGSTGSSVSGLWEAVPIS